MGRGSRRLVRVRVVALAMLAALLVLGPLALAGRTVAAEQAQRSAQGAAELQLTQITTALRDDPGGWGIVDAIRSAPVQGYDDGAVAATGPFDTDWLVTSAAGRVYAAHGLLRSYITVGQTVAPDATGGLVQLRFGPAPSPCDIGCDLAQQTVWAAVAPVSGGALTAPLTVYVLVRPYAVAERLGVVDPLLWFGVGLGVLLAGGLSLWVVARVLRPVEAMRTELSRITAGDLSRRVPVPPVGDELRRWALTTNETLDRLEAAVGKHRSFVADAAHELRSPLAGLLNTLEVAAAHPDRAELLGSVHAALAEARRLQRLTDDLLLLARLDRTAPPPVRAEVDVDALAIEQVAERRFRSGGPRLTLSTMDGARVPGDEGQLSRVLRNLLDNAAAYARDCVHVIVAREPHDRVRIEVLDDGPGIPAADRERVFDRFARLDPARERHRGGAGLGLAIAREIVLQHGGEIEVADSPAGARLVVRLPGAPLPVSPAVPAQSVPA